MFSPAAVSGSGQQAAPAPATAAVVREDLAAVTPVTATLGYAGSCTVTGQGGTLTWLPLAGQVIRQGQALYKTGNGSPVVLLYDSVPDWRDLDEGVTGQDVSQLNHDRVGLGDADSTDISALGWNYLSCDRDPHRDHSFLATSGPVMRRSSGNVAAMMPRETTIPAAVSR
jgi:hypothetical protein